ncbi:MAG TPA: histidine phosphatase family protein [Xanthomonadales bacterium]|nr:histidine phosphatase family protein [Xanthomonadales bacterium]
MQTLLILRHAKAVPWSPVKEDFPRKLSAAGTEQAKRIAQWTCQNLELPQSILCSPSQRTRETLAPLLFREPALEAVTHFLPQIYHATVNTLESLLDSAFAEAERVLMVGHNPGFEVLVGEVIHPRHYDQFSRLPTGTLVVVDFENGWAAGHQQGSLRHIIRGKDLSGD